MLKRWIKDRGIIYMEKFEVELKIVKSKIHEEDLAEDFRDKLERELCEKYNNANASKNKFKLLRKPVLTCKNVAAVFVCFLLLSGCAFADDIEDFIKFMFSNVSQSAKIAYEEGNCIKVDSEYQTYDNVSAKVEYISLKNDELYIVFDVKTEEEFDKIYLEGLKLENAGEEIEYSQSSYDVKRENLEKCKLIARLSLNTNENKDIKSLKISFESIVLRNGNDNEIKKFDNHWNFELNL